MEGEKEEVSVGHTIKKKGENAKNVLGGVHSVGGVYLSSSFSSQGGELSY